MESNRFPVKIHLYDLSQGMAKQLSKGILGKEIEGIWHTGIIVYGKEYYWGAEIYRDNIGQTPFGRPLKVIEMGETEIPQEVFESFLKEISPSFTPDQYDLFKKNCNNFTTTCCEFLTGQPIPEYITGLPSEVLQTPFGKMIAPMIQQMQSAVQLQSQSATTFHKGDNSQTSGNPQVFDS